MDGGRVDGGRAGLMDGGRAGLMDGKAANKVLILFKSSFEPFENLQKTLEFTF